VRVRSRRLLLTAVFLFAAIAPPAIAQLRDRDRTFEASEKLATDLRKARLHWGPFYLLSYIQFSDLGYDQTYYFPTKDQTAGFSLAVSAPQRLYFVPNRKSIYALEATPEIGFFSGKGSHKQFGYLLKGDANYLLNHVFADFFVQRSSLLQALTGEINRIATQTETSGGVNGELRYSTKTRLLYKAVVRKQKYPMTEYQPTDVSIAKLDREQHEYGLSFRHRTFPLTSLTLNATRTDYSLPNAPEKSGKRVFFGPGFLYDSGLTTMNGQIGPARFTYDQPGQHSFSGVLGNFALNHRVSTYTSWDFDAARDLEISIFTANNYYVTDRLHLGGQRQMTRRLTILAGTTYGRDTYDVPVIVNGIPGIRRRDNMFLASVGWRYALRHARGGFDVAYYKRTSNVGIDEENGIRLLLQLSLSP